MRKIFTLILFLFISGFLWSQLAKLDSLRQEFNSKQNDSLRLNAYAHLVIEAYHQDFETASIMNDSLIEMSTGVSDFYLATGYRMRGTLALLDGNYDESISSYNNALDIFEKLENYKQKNRVLNNIAVYYGRRNEPEKADSLYKLGLQNAYLFKDTAEIIGCLNNMGITATKLSNYLQSIEYFQESLRYARMWGNIDYIGHNLVGIGEGYIKQKEYEDAQIHLQEALELAKNNDYKWLLAIVYNALAVLYEERDQDYGSALSFQKKHLALQRSINQKLGIVDAYYKIGLLFQKMGKLDSAYNSYSYGYVLAEELNNDPELEAGELLLSSLHYELGQDDEAKRYLNKAQSRESYDPYNQDHVKIYDDIAKRQANRGLHKEAYKSLRTYVTMADSIYQSTLFDRIKEINTKYQVAEAKYQTEKKEKELLIEKHKSKTRVRNLLFALAGIVFLAFTIVQWILRRSKKKENLFEQEKANLLQDKSQLELEIENFQKELDEKSAASHIDQINIIDRVETELIETHSLTSKDIEYWRLQAKGWPDKVILDFINRQNQRMGKKVISKDAIDQRRHRLYRKLKVDNDRQAIAVYMERMRIVYHTELEKSRSSQS